MSVERLPVVPKRLVEKKLVVVAEVPVAFTKVKFCKVEDEVVRNEPCTSSLAVVEVAVAPINTSVVAPPDGYTPLLLAIEVVAHLLFPLVK